MTLLWMPEGPMMKYQNGMLYISDLNPEQHMRWVMSRSEMFWLGWKCIKGALGFR